MSVKLLPVHPAVYEPAPEEALDDVYEDAMTFHRLMMRSASPEDEKTRLALLMKITVRAAMDICEKDGCAPSLDGLLDLCRDAFDWAARRDDGVH